MTRASAFTCVNNFIDEAPARRVLHGDKTKKLEAAQHVIEFPGGAIELSRCEDGAYWAHIIINRGQALPVLRGFGAAQGEVVDSRMDWAERGFASIPSLPDETTLTQIAVRIRPVTGAAP